MLLFALTSSPRAVIAITCTIRSLSRFIISALQIKDNCTSFTHTLLNFGNGFTLLIFIGWSMHFLSEIVFKSRDKSNICRLTAFFRLFKDSGARCDGTCASGCTGSVTSLTLISNSTLKAPSQVTFLVKSQKITFSGICSAVPSLFSLFTLLQFLFIPFKY